MNGSDVLDRLRAEARAADDLHERSRSLLVGAARAGAAAGLSQRVIASAIGRSQPEVSRLLRFHGTSVLGRRVTQHRKEILDRATRYGIRNLRVFGSVARGTDRPDSDVDLLVDIPAGTSLFALARLESELAELLGTNVDVIPATNLREHLAEHVQREAVQL